MSLQPRKLRCDRQLVGSSNSNPSNRIPPAEPTRGLPPPDDDDSDRVDDVGLQSLEGGFCLRNDRFVHNPHKYHISRCSGMFSALAGIFWCDLTRVSAPPQSSIALYSALKSRLPPSKSLIFPAEWLLLVAPLLLSMTLFANSPGMLSLVLLFPTALLLIVPRRESGTPLPSNLKSPSPNRTQYASNPAHGQHSPIIQLPALTTYRAHMILMTVLSILAVDFPVFPRSLAKCETYGVSLVGAVQWFLSETSLTVWGLADGLGCGFVCVLPRGGFRNPNYQVPGSFAFSTEAKNH